MSDIDAQTDIEKAKTVISELERKREMCVKRGVELGDQRSAISYAAHVDNDKGSRAKLDKINIEVATYESELASIDSAIQAANAKLAAVERRIGLREERARALRLKQAALDLQELAPTLDEALDDFVRCTLALELGGRAIRSNGGVVPNDQQIAMLWRCVNTAMMKTPFARSFETVPPNERKPFSHYLTQWADLNAKEAEHLLQVIDGQTDKEKAA
jgi:hypothetical protein